MQVRQVMVQLGAHPRGARCNRAHNSCPRGILAILSWHLYTYILSQSRITAHKLLTHSLQHACITATATGITMDIAEISRRFVKSDMIKASPTSLINLAMVLRNVRPACWISDTDATLLMPLIRTWFPDELGITNDAMVHSKDLVASFPFLYTDLITICTKEPASIAYSMASSRISGTFPTWNAPRDPVTGTVLCEAMVSLYVQVSTSPPTKPTLFSCFPDVHCLATSFYPAGESKNAVVCMEMMARFAKMALPNASCIGEKLYIIDFFVGYGM